MCPACGNRQGTVVFEPPSNARGVVGERVTARDLLFWESRSSRMFSRCSYEMVLIGERG